MVFDITNAERINSKDVYLHDDLFRELKFEREAYRLVVQCFSYDKGDYQIIYHDVIGFEMSSGDFWGASPNINCWYALSANDCILIPKLQKEQEKYDASDDTPIDNAHYIETKLELLSGDSLRVACKSIQFEYHPSQAVEKRRTRPDKYGVALELD